VHGQNFQRLIADDLESRMWDVAEVNAACPRRKLLLLAIGRFDCGTLEEVECFLAVMDIDAE
jgi:hypothetical protein